MIFRILFAVLVIFSSTLCWAEQPTAEQKFVQHAARYITTQSPQLDKDRGYWLAEQIYASAKLFSIDPHMLLALIKVESRFDSAAIPTRRKGSNANRASLSQATHCRGREHFPRRYS